MNSAVMKNVLAVRDHITSMLQSRRHRSDYNSERRSSSVAVVLQ